MELSIFVAKIISLIYLSAGVAALTGQIVFGDLVEDFEKSPALTYIAGFMTLVIGALLVEHHNIWVKDWPVLITVISWIALFKGIWLIAFPKTISRFRGMYKNSWPWGVLMLALGLMFGYFGFVK